MEEYILITFILIIDLAFAFLFGNIAKKKGFPGAAWGIIGFFIPAIYIILLLLPNRNMEITTKSKKQEETEDNNNYIGIFFSIIGVGLLIGFIMLVSNTNMVNQEAEDNYKQYIYDCLTSGYLGVQTNNFENSFEDQKIYIQDLYKLYNDGYFYDYDDFESEEDGEFTDYYEENEEILKDDYIIVVNVSKPGDSRSSWETYYYDSYNEKQEIVDYSINYAIAKYEENKTNNYENDVKSENVKIATLYEKGYFSNYFKKVYEKNKDKIKNDYIKVEAKGGKIYDKNYFES